MRAANRGAQATDLPGRAQQPAFFRPQFVFLPDTLALVQADAISRRTSMSTSASTSTRL